MQLISIDVCSFIAGTVFGAVLLVAIIAVASIGATPDGPRKFL